MPTIKNHKDDYFFHVLCFSYGCANEREKIVEKEFENVCHRLQLHKYGIINDENLEKSKNQWPASFLSNKIIEYVQNNGIKALISYDEYFESGLSQAIK